MPPRYSARSRLPQLTKRRRVQDEDEEEEREKDEEEEDVEKDEQEQEHRQQREEEQHNEEPHDEEQLEEEAEEEIAAGTGRKGKGKELAKETILRHANAVVRLALFSESRKLGIKREDINKKILIKDTRAFNDVFERSQKILRRTFGMELVPIRAKGKGVAADGADISNTGKGKRRGDDNEEETTSKKRKTVQVDGPVRSYMLRSLLDPRLIALAVEPQPELAQEANLSADSENDDEIEVSENRRPSGALIDLRLADEVGLMGLLYTILALLLVNGRRLPNDQLRAYLARLNLRGSTILPTTTPTHIPLTLDLFLAQCKRQLYLENPKSHHPIAQAPSAADIDGDTSILWAWGSRAEIEVGENMLTELIGDLYLVDEDAPAEEDADEEPAAARKTRLEKMKKARDQLRRDVSRAAGSALQD